MTKHPPSATRDHEGSAVRIARRYQPVTFLMLLLTMLREQHTLSKLGRKQVEPSIHQYRISLIIKALQTMAITKGFYAVLYNGWMRFHLFQYSRGKVRHL